MTNRIHQPDTAADISLRDALSADEGFSMTAGAGSGKITSLVKGLDFIRNKFGSELRGMRRRVACITYTEVATAEILEDVGDDDLFHVSTIHSFIWELIGPFTKEIRNWLHIEISDKIQELKEHNEKPRTQNKTKIKNNRKIEFLTANLKSIAGISKFRYQLLVPLILTHQCIQG